MLEKINKDMYNCSKEELSLMIKKITSSDKLKGNSLMKINFNDMLIEYSNTILRQNKRFSENKQLELSKVNNTEINEGNSGSVIMSNKKEEYLYDIILSIKSFRSNLNNYIENIQKIPKVLHFTLNNNVKFTSTLQIRREIWRQSNARLKFIDQKHKAFILIFNKLDNLLTLTIKKVITIHNIEKFNDIIVDIQNSFSSELEYIKSNKTYVLPKDFKSFNREFSGFAIKFKENLMTSKIGDKAEIIDALQNLLLKFSEIYEIYNENQLQLLINNHFQNQNTKEKNSYESENYKVNNLINPLIGFILNFIFNLIMKDLEELTLRFLKKKILSFEEK